MRHVKSEPLISVIVPVYNVRDYLEDCLESITKQSYTNLEIIIVDDGSTDGSAEICDRHAQADSRIRVIHQKNQGVARARKRAVLCAAGVYTGFVDADDTISSEMIEFMTENIENCDAITVGCYCEDASGDYVEQTDAIEEGIYESEEEIEYFQANMLAYQGRFEYGVRPYLVNKLFKTPLLQEVVSNIDSRLSYAEDGEVLFQYLLKCKGIRVTYKCLYYYRYRVDSALHTVDKNYMKNLNEIYLALEKAFEEQPQKEVLMRQLQLFVTQRIYWITARMGFPADTGLMSYGFPYSDLEKSKRIVLYGAGKIGVTYYRQIHLYKRAEMVLWVDKNWEKYRETYMPVSDPKGIKECKYDFIIIAVMRRTLAEEIRRELVQQGIDEERILWRVPAVFI